MVDLCAMIMINKMFSIWIFLFLFILSSCETLQDFAGLSKPDLERELLDATPELVLPPDFNRVARSSDRREIQQNNNLNNTLQQTQFQTIQPRVTNFIAPQINIQSSPTPSDSLERFKENKKFTIGEWVYGQYVQGFKQGNLYYKPIYDKGYNFSRRYLPDQNVSSFLNQPIPQSNYGNFDNRQMIQNQPSIENLDNLPIID